MPPAVKGTAADKSSRRPFPTFDPRKPRTPYRGVAAAAQKPPMPEQHLHGHTDPAKRAAPNTIASGHVRDPHPYTGFTASSNKTEMLLQSLDQRLAEEDASSKRSVLYDPMTDDYGRGFAQSLSIRPESSISAKHASSALRRDGFLGGLNFQRDLLNKSDPLPPVPNLTGREVDSNQIGYSSAQPNQRDDVFGAYPTTNAFTTSNMNYLREQQRQRQLQQRQEQEENARFIPAYDTGFALEELAMTYEPKSQAEQDAEVMAWFTKPYAEGSHVRDMLSKAGAHSVGNRNKYDLDEASDNSTPPLTARYLQTRWDYTTAAPAAKVAATLSSPAAGLDLLSPLLANLHTHQLNNFRDCPFTRYTIPPAWCIDTTGLPGSKDSFFGEGEEGGWNPPKRVGRDKRRVMRVIEGRATYFEEGVGVGVVSPGSSAV
ncbi:MAG: hypothetical protein OHK93_006316 [Ramalina farinacea]|uniref:Uncharacterized protein n=1 Tax=Ramalina farinacea TaxID=258253 RepID=A0AA43TSX6_9LECA|nr:hypothetical protein [Ramalina farinacea]